MTHLLRTLFALALVLVFSAGAAAQINLDIVGPGQGKMNLTLGRPLGLEASAPPEAAELQRLINANLSMLPFLAVVPGNAIPGGDDPGGVTAEKIDFKRYQLAKVDLLVTSGWKRGPGLGTVELRAIQAFDGKLVLGKAYEAADKNALPQIANRFCSQLVEALTGRPGFFDTLIAFTKKRGGGREVWVVGPTGQGLRQVTSIGGINMNPAWSWDGRYIAFTHVGQIGHELGVVDFASGNVRTINLGANSVIGPSFAPDGRLAVSLDKTGQPDIYMLDRDFRPGQKLVSSWAIDISPSFDASGSNMAFVSSRLGNPHVFLWSGGSERRLTLEGKYNTSPSMSPDGAFVTYSRQMPDGHRIFVADIKNGGERQVSFGPGSDEDPHFSPDGFFIVFTSSRAGGYKLYLTTRNGETPVQIPTGDGDASAPAWSSRGSGGQ